MEVIFTILFILVSIWIVRLMLEQLKLSFVLAELLVGMIIGPPVLGLLGSPGSFFEWTPCLDLIAELGMFFLMFYAGLSANPEEMGEKS